MSSLSNQSCLSHIIAMPAFLTKKPAVKVIAAVAKTLDSAFLGLSNPVIPLIRLDNSDPPYQNKCPFN